MAMGDYPPYQQWQYPIYTTWTAVPQQGWQCPKCLTVYAPWMAMCSCQKQGEVTITTTNSEGANEGC